MLSFIGRNAKARYIAGPALFLGMMSMIASDDGHAGEQSAVHTVVIEALQFTPALLEAHVGDTIIWKNKDSFPHTVTAADRSFDSGQIAPNASWKWKVSRKGTLAYICTLHPTMKASLAVH